MEKFCLNILKKSNFTFDKLTECVNYTLKNGKFPDSLKNATITPVYKKDDPTDKVNYRPVSVLPLPSKIFEKVIYNQLREYMDLFLNKLLCGFRKAYSTQHALFKLLHSWQKELDNSGFVAQSSWTSLTCMTAYPMTLLLQNLKLMV